MEHSIAKTSVLGAVPAAVWTGIQLAPGALVVGNMFWSAYGMYSGYQKVKGLKDWLATVPDRYLGYFLHFGNATTPASPASVVTAITNTTNIVTETANSVSSNEMIAEILGAGTIWNGANAFIKRFKLQHGKDKLSLLKKTSETQLNKALSRRGTLDAAWKQAYFNQMGQNAPQWLQNLSPENAVLAGGFLLAILTYFQKIGEKIMRANAAPMGADLRFPLESGMVNDWLDSFLRKPKELCYGLYFQHAYYHKTDGAAAGPAFDGGSVFRIIINTIIGMLSLNPFISLKTNDPVDVFLKAAEALGYWEIFTRLIGLYGWAPVYITTHWLLKILARPAPTGAFAHALSYIKKQ